MTPTPRPISDESSYLQLRNEIITGKLMPNQRLVEAELAKHLDTSRATVRLVLLRLEYEGLVVREPNRGAHVRFIDEQEALEITEARTALEALAASRAAIMADDNDISEIKVIHDEMVKHYENGDLMAYSDTNRRLHARVIEASRHVTVARMLAELKAQLVRFQYRTVLVPGRAQNSLAEHTALVEAIVAHDPNAAAEAMTHHLDGVKAALMKAATTKSDYPLNESIASPMEEK